MSPRISCRHPFTHLIIKAFSTCVISLTQVCLSIDHPQKVLIMGEAMDLGTCKAKKKNGEPCTQIVNLVSLKSVSLVFAYEKNQSWRIDFGCWSGDEQTEALKFTRSHLARSVVRLGEMGSLLPVTAPSLLTESSPGVCPCSMIVSTASITSRPSTRSLAQSDQICSPLSLGGGFQRSSAKAPAWKSDCAKMVSTTAGFLLNPLQRPCKAFLGAAFGKGFCLSLKKKLVVELFCNCCTWASFFIAEARVVKEAFHSQGERHTFRMNGKWFMLWSEYRAHTLCLARCGGPHVQALQRLRQKEHESMASLSYIGRTCPKWRKQSGEMAWPLRVHAVW